MTSPIYQERDEKNLQSDIAISRVEQVQNTALHMVKITSEKYRWMHVFFFVPVIERFMFSGLSTSINFAQNANNMLHLYF